MVAATVAIALSRPSMPTARSARVLGVRHSAVGRGVAVASVEVVHESCRYPVRWQSCTPLRGSGPAIGARGRAWSSGRVLELVLPDRRRVPLAGELTIG